MSIIKNPIILALITSIVVFIIMYYFYGTDNQSDEIDDSGDLKKKKKNSSKKYKNSKNPSKKYSIETMIIISAAVGLTVWFATTRYFNPNTTNNEINTNDVIQKVNINPNLTKNATTTNTINFAQPLTHTQSNGNSFGQGVGRGQQVLAETNFTKPTIASNKSITHRIDSEDPTKSYDLIGSGLNIPRSELKIPNVLIDYR
jgi:hypothetical protein